MAFSKKQYLKTAKRIIQADIIHLKKAGKMRNVSIRETTIKEIDKKLGLLR